MDRPGLASLGPQTNAKLLRGNRHLITTMFGTSEKVPLPKKINFSKSGRVLKDFVRFSGLTTILDSQL